jgi:hypothetical protein
MALMALVDQAAKAEAVPEAPAKKKAAPRRKPKVEAAGEAAAEAAPKKKSAPRRKKAAAG